MDELNEFIRDNRLDRESGISIVSEEDISQLRSTGYSVEDLLDHLNEHYQSLLHGSRTEFNNHLKPNEEGRVFSTDSGAIALLKAVISNELPFPGLKYPYFIDGRNPLVVKIHGINDETIGEKGFVYVLNQRQGFTNDPTGSWQYIKRGETPIAARIPVKRSDFAYPIIDVTNSRIIQ
ncbi:hypothetical protein HOC80_05125 [archaeon]|nr:hypothetical protein [archaeon]MBT4417455.1 hypothetical protein [archaeon]